MNIRAMVEWLQKNRNNKGTMADLRRALRTETKTRAWPYLSHFCDLTKPREELVGRMVCGLYALHPNNAIQGNFGASLRTLAVRRKDPDLKVHERYLTNLVSARDGIDVCERLHFLVRMMHSEGVPIDYEKLAQDLYYWDHTTDPDRVRREWCMGYYQRREKDVPDQSNAA